MDVKLPRVAMSRKFLIDLFELTLNRSHCGFEQ
jgi:hypothetical protein